MNNKQLEYNLSKYLTVQDIVKMGVPRKTIDRWILVGKRLCLKGKGLHKFSDPIKLPTPKIKSKVLVNPKDLVKFLKKIGRDELIVNIPTYLRK
jgi:hypothetical protein